MFYESLGEDLEEGGLPRTLERLRAVLRERRPGILIIDSFKALAAYAASQRDFRSFLFELAADTSAVAGSSFWLGEYDLDTIASEPEAAVADSIIGLALPPIGRALQSPSRGDQAARQRLPLRPARISDQRRRAERLPAAGRHRSTLRATTSVPNERQRASTPSTYMLSDGYWPGSSTLCAGPSGIGKTLMGLHFIVAGAGAGEPGIIASLQENPTQLTRVARAFGWTLDDSVTMMYRSPVDLYVDEWIYELLDAIDRLEAKRVLIDSLTDVLFASGDEIGFREYMYSLIQRCSRTGVSLFMTTELPDLFAVNRLSEYGVSHLSDNVLILQYIRDQSTIRRAITTLKTRASSNDPRVREFRIGSEGITIDDTPGP